MTEQELEEFERRMMGKDILLEEDIIEAVRQLGGLKSLSLKANPNSLIMLHHCSHMARVILRLLELLSDRGGRLGYHIMVQHWTSRAIKDLPAWLEALPKELKRDAAVRAAATRKKAVKGGKKK